MSGTTTLKRKDVNHWITFNRNKLKPEDTGEVHVHFAREDSSSTISCASSFTERPVYGDESFPGKRWLVVLYGFILLFVADGIGFSFPVVFSWIEHRYNASKKATGVTVSLFLALPLILVPVAGVVSDVVGCRKALRIGTTLAVVGAFLSIYATTLTAFIFTFSLLCGIGLAFIFNAAIVVVTYFFEERRGLATSLVVLGTGCGTAALGTLFNLLGSLHMCLIAITLLFVLTAGIAFLVEDPQWTTDTTEFKKRKFEKHLKEMMLEERKSIAEMQDVEPRHAMSMPCLLLEHRPQKIATLSTVDVRDSPGAPPRSQSFAFTPQHFTPNFQFSMVTESTLDHLQHLDLVMPSTPGSVERTRRRVTSKASASLDALDTQFLSVDFDSSSDESEMSNDGMSSSSEFTVSNAPPTPLNGTLQPRALILPRGSIAMRHISGRVMAYNALYLTGLNRLSREHRAPSAPTLAIRKKRRSAWAKLGLRKLLNEMSEEIMAWPKKLRLPEYATFLLSTAMLYFIMEVPTICMADHAAESLNITKNVADKFTIVYGISNLLGTVVFGLLTDVECAKPHLFLMYTMAMMVIAFTHFCLFAFAQDVVTLFVIAAVAGTAVSSNYVLQSILLTIIFPNMTDFQAGYAMVCSVQGVTNLLGPFFAGYVRDTTGSYYTVFFYGSIVALISAALSFATHLLMPDDKEKPLKLNGHGESMIPLIDVESVKTTHAMETTKAIKTPHPNGILNGLNGLHV